MNVSKPYESPELRAVCGPALRPGGLELTAEALELCAFEAGAKILDLGCGAGATLKLLRDKGFEALGLDISPVLLAEAREHGPVMEADFQRIPLDDETLDGIFCECALSLAPDKDKVLAESFRVLKAGGRLVLSDLVLKTDRLAGDLKKPGGANCLNGAESPAALAARLQRAGFHIETELDHSRALKELAARLLWSFGSIDALKKLWGAEAVCGPAAKALGYMTFIALKK